MGRKVLCACLALGLLAPGPLPAQAPADLEVAKGIKQVEDGDLDIAIFTLDAAARRLAADPSRTRELAQAYLYLGIAYLGKGQETLAKTKFREAVQQIRELSLNPDQFPPRVIEFLDAAKQELAKAAPAPSAAPASPAPAAQPSPTAKSKGGSKLPLILLGVGGAAAVGIAAAAGGGGSSAAAGSAAVADTRRSLTLPPEVLTLAMARKELDVTPTAAGTLEAMISWTEPGANLILYLDDPSMPAQSIVVSERSLAPGRTRQISAAVTVRPYRVGVLHCTGGCTGPLSTSNATFTLQVKVP